MTLQQLKKRQQTLLNLIANVGGRSNVRKWVDELMCVEAKIEYIPQAIQVGSRVLKKHGGSLVTGTVLEIKSGEALVKWDKNHNFKKNQKLKDLQLHSEEAVKKIVDRKNQKAYKEFKELALNSGEWVSAWDGYKTVYPFWAVERGLIELAYNGRSVASFRVTQKGMEFAASI